MTKLDSGFSKAEDSPGFLLWKASNLLQRIHTVCLKDLDVTPGQFSLMTCLVYLHQSGMVTAARIVKHTGMDKMSVSDLVKTLVKKGLVVRKANPADGRSYVLEPTNEGIRTTNLAVRKVEAIDTRFFGRLSNIGAFQKALLVLIEAEEH